MKKTRLANVVVSKWNMCSFSLVDVMFGFESSSHKDALAVKLQFSRWKA